MKKKNPKIHEFERIEGERARLQEKHKRILSECFEFAPSIGWLPLVDNLLTRIENLDSHARVKQVKNKFGGLRVHVQSDERTVHRIIDEAEVTSLHVCEKCGGKHTLRECEA